MADTAVSRRALLAGAAGALLAGCSSRAAHGRAAAPPAPPTGQPAGQAAAGQAAGQPASGQAAPGADAPASAAELLAHATLPVLCWHQLRDWTAADSAYDRAALICPPASFRRQLDALADGGWTTIGPDRYLAHLRSGAPLPPRSVMLSFDDSQGSQLTEGLPQLQARGMTATFFAMTVVLGKPRWLSADDLRRLRDAGMTVAAHTYDHHRVDRYAGNDWAVQLDRPRELLERILGAPVRHFAYPYGAWAPEAFAHLQSAGYDTAFQLSDKPVDLAAPLYTLRRLLVTSTWDGPQLLRRLQPT